MKPKLQYLVESSTNEWYTPHHIVASVKAVFHGVIDLDPYSCDAANAIVGATTYFTKEDDAFLSDWPVVDSVFANPPYERKVIDRCVTQLIAYRRRWTATRFQMIVLVNAATEVSWFFALMTNCDAVCFTKGGSSTSAVPTKARRGIRAVKRCSTLVTTPSDLVRFLASMGIFF